MSKPYNEADWKKTFDNHTTQPPFEVWSRIEQTLQKKKRRPALLWFIYIGCGIGMLGLLFFKISVNHTTDNGLNSSYAEQNNNLQNVVKDKSNTLPLHNMTTTSNEILNSFTPAKAPKANKDLSRATNKNQNYYSIVTDKNQLDELSPTNLLSHAPLNTNPSTAKVNERRIEDDVQKSINIDASTLLYLPSLMSRCENNDEEKISAKIYCPTFKSKKKIHFFLESGLAFGLHKKAFTTSENTKLAMLRNQSESEWYTWAAVLRGGLYISPSLSIGTGFEYMQLKDRFNVSESKITKPIITYDTITGPPLDASLVRGTLVNKGENRYTLINIPLLLRYEKTSPFWKLGIDGGVLLNARFINSGKMYNEKLAVEKFKNNTAVFKTSLGLGYQVGLMVSKRINVGTDLFLRPSFTTFGKNWTIGGYDPATAYTVFRCEIGVRRVM